MFHEGCYKNHVKVKYLFKMQDSIVQKMIPSCYLENELVWKVMEDSVMELNLLSLLFFLYTSHSSQKDVLSSFSKDSEYLATLKKGHFQENTTMTQLLTLRLLNLFIQNSLYTNYKNKLITSLYICLSFY